MTAATVISPPAYFLIERVISRWRADGALLLGLVLLAVDCPVSHGVEEITLTLGDIEGAGWFLKGLEARLAWLDDHTASLGLKAAKAMLPEPLGSSVDLGGECPQLTITPQRISCHAGVLRLGPGYPGAGHLHIEFDYRVDTGRIELAVDNLRMDGGRIAANMELDRAGWKLTVQGSAMQLAAVSARLVEAGMLPAPLSGPGTLGLTARLQGIGARLQTGRLSARMQSTEFSDAEGRLSGVNLGLSLEVMVKPVADRWQVTGRLDGSRGQLYIDPVFIDLDPRPVHASAELEWWPSSGQLQVRSLDYDHPGTVRLHAAGLLSLERTVRLEDLSLDITEGRFPGLFDTYLQPWLNDTALADLLMAGAVSAAIRWQQGRIAGIRLDLDDVSFDDREGRYGLGGLQGRVDWAAEEATRHSDLRVAGRASLPGAAGYGTDRRGIDRVKLAPAGTRAPQRAGRRVANRCLRTRFSRRCSLGLENRRHSDAGIPAPTVPVTGLAGIRRQAFRCHSERALHRRQARGRRHAAGAGIRR